jgi:hypothetical protein
MNRLNAEAVEILVDTLEDIWASLRSDEKARTNRMLIAHRLLIAVAAGERDPAQLRIKAVTGVVTSAL